MKNFFLLIIVFFISFPVYGFEYEKEIEKQLEQTNLNDVVKNSGGFDIVGKIKQIISGEYKIDIIRTIKTVFYKLTDNMKSSYSIVFTLGIISLLSAVTENIKNSFKTKSDIEFYVFFSVIVVYGIKLYSDCVSDATIALDNLLLFTNSLFPVMLTTLASGGGVTGAATLHPILMVCGGFVMMLIKTVVLPAFSIGVALQLSNAFSTDLQAGRMAKFISSFVKWTIGIMMTVFVGVVTVTGITIQSFDSVSIRATKYAIGNFIPMVGGVISDSFDLILNGSAVIKSSVGLAGLINILFLCLTPCLKLAAIAITFNICAAVVEPVCNKKITDTIEIFGKSAFTLFGILCAAACMFILCTGVLISLKTG